MKHIRKFNESPLINDYGFNDDKIIEDAILDKLLNADGPTDIFGIKDAVYKKNIEDLKGGKLFINSRITSVLDNMIKKGLVHYDSEARDYMPTKLANENSDYKGTSFFHNREDLINKILNLQKSHKLSWLASEEDISKLDNHDLNDLLEIINFSLSKELGKRVDGTIGRII